MVGSIMERLQVRVMHGSDNAILSDGIRIVVNHSQAQINNLAGTKKYSARAKL
jgi:hypothetical protein